jgi:hypothetical protein
MEQPKVALRSKNATQIKETAQTALDENIELVYSQE